MALLLIKIYLCSLTLFLIYIALAKSLPLWLKVILIITLLILLNIFGGI